MYRVSQYLVTFPKELLLYILQDFYIYFIYCKFNDAVGTALNNNIFVYLWTGRTSKVFVAWLQPLSQHLDIQIFWDGPPRSSINSYSPYQSSQCLLRQGQATVLPYLYQSTRYNTSVDVKLQHHRCHYIQSRIRALLWKYWGKTLSNRLWYPVYGSWYGTRTFGMWNKKVYPLDSNFGYINSWLGLLTIYSFVESLVMNLVFYVRINCKEKIKGEMEVTRRWGRRRKKLLDDLKNRRGYYYLQQEALDRTVWRNRFGRDFGPVVRQNTEWMKLWITCDSIQLICMYWCTG
jgi:hypothetical protein